MTDELTIGELSARSGVAPSALRFYEAEGLIDADRTGGNQRRYPRATLRRVALVQAGRAATLQALGNRLTTCIGCGCLSIDRCGLLNPDDEAATLGPGAHYLHSDSRRAQRE
jgi:MerR family redox-sensitive transcriptional activator SoxR